MPTVLLLLELLNLKLNNIFIFILLKINKEDDICQNFLRIF